MKNLEINKEKNNGQSYSKLQWILFVVIIPLIFAITLGLVILTVSGMNIFDIAKQYGSKIPVVSSYIGDAEKKTTEQQLKNDIIEQQAIVEEKQLKIEELEEELGNKELEIDALKKEIQRLNAEIEALTTAETNNEQQLTMSDIVNVYESMSAKNAAAIIPEMNDDDAIRILSALDSEKAAAILEKMDAANAAKYTSLLTKRAETTNN